MAIFEETVARFYRTHRLLIFAFRRVVRGTILCTHRSAKQPASYSIRAYYAHTLHSASRTSYRRITNTYSSDRTSRARTKLHSTDNYYAAIPKNARNERKSYVLFRIIQYLYRYVL